MRNQPVLTDNPATWSDPSGYGLGGYSFSSAVGTVGTTLLGAVVGALTFGGINAIWQAITTGTIDYEQVKYWALVGALTGASLGFSFSPILSGTYRLSAAVWATTARLSAAGISLATYVFSTITTNLFHNHNVSSTGEGEYNSFTDGLNPLDASMFTFTGALLGGYNYAAAGVSSTTERLLYYYLGGVGASTLLGGIDIGADYYFEDEFSACDPAYGYSIYGGPLNLISEINHPLGIAVSIGANVIVNSGTSYASESHVPDTCSFSKGYSD